MIFLRVKNAGVRIAHFILAFSPMENIGLTYDQGKKDDVIRKILLSSEYDLISFWNQIMNEVEVAYIFVKGEFVKRIAAMKKLITFLVPFL